MQMYILHIPRLLNYMYLALGTGPRISCQLLACSCCNFVFRVFLFDVCHFYRANYALAVYAMVVCLCVCVSVCLSQVGVLLKWLNVGTRKQRHTIAQGL